jgi:N-acetyl-anhydromuramyl-L-alanine amidase AmpD
MKRLAVACAVVGAVAAAVGHSRAEDTPPPRLEIKWVDLKVDECTQQKIWRAKSKPQTSIGVGTANLTPLERWTVGDRDPKKCVHYLVLHEGFREKTIEKFAAGNAKGGDPKSTHFVITRDGTLVQAADLRRVAWHALNVSFWSVGVDLEIDSDCDVGYSCVSNKACSAKCEYTDAQYRAVDTLIRALAPRTSIVRDDAHVMAHCQVFGNGHADPRNFDWKRIGLDPDKHRKNGNYVNGSCVRAFDEDTFDLLKTLGFPKKVPIATPVFVK